MDPIIFGDYPTSMHQYLGSRLPKFTEEHITLIKGSYDWIGFNHYSTQYAYHTKGRFTLWPSKPRGRGSEWPNFVESPMKWAENR